MNTYYRYKKYHSGGTGDLPKSAVEATAFTILRYLQDSGLCRKEWLQKTNDSQKSAVLMDFIQKIQDSQKDKVANAPASIAIEIFIIAIRNNVLGGFEYDNTLIIGHLVHIQDIAKKIANVREYYAYSRQPK